MINVPSLEHVQPLDFYSTPCLSEVLESIKTEKDLLFKELKPKIGRDLFAYYVKEKKSNLGTFYKIFKFFSASMSNDSYRIHVKLNKVQCYENVGKNIISKSKKKEIIKDTTLEHNVTLISRNLFALILCKSDLKDQKTWIGFFARKVGQIKHLEKLHNYLNSFTYYQSELNKRNHIESTIAKCKSLSIDQVNNLKGYLGHGIRKYS